MLVTSYIVAALYLRFAGVPLATPIGFYYNFSLYKILLVYKEALYFILAIPYVVSKHF